MHKSLKTAVVEHNLQILTEFPIVLNCILSYYIHSIHFSITLLSLIRPRSQHFHQMDQDRHVHWSPQTLRSSKDPESDTSLGEPSTDRVLVRSTDPAKTVPSATPTRPNAPEEEKDERQEKPPPNNTLRSLIRQTLQPRQPQTQPQPRPPPTHPPLTCEELRKRWTRFTSLTLALEHRAKVHAHGSAFCKEALQALRQIKYVLQLVENHMGRHGGGAAGGLDPEPELQELREQVEKIV